MTPVNGVEETANAATAGDAAVQVFAEARDRFDRAVRLEGGVVERACAIGGHVFVLRFAGPALLAHLTPALAHVTMPPGARVPPGALTIGIWHGAMTDAHAPALPEWWWRDSTFRGPVQASHGDRIHSAVHAGTLSLFDAARAEALYFVSDVAQLTTSEVGSPLLRILHWWLRDRGLQLVHGGAIGTPEGGVILAGRGGSGKSTISLLSLDSPLRYAADDYCVVATEPAPFVHSLFCSGKVDAGDVGRFPFLASALRHPGQPGVEKALFLLHDAFAARLATGFPVRAVIVPRVTGEQTTTITRIPASAGLLALAPSTVFQLPGAGASALRALGRLTSQVPCFRLDAGWDFAAIPGVIGDLLARL